MIIYSNCMDSVEDDPEGGALPKHNSLTTKNFIKDPKELVERVPDVW